jgi:hypothetical protein
MLLKATWVNFCWCSIPLQVIVLVFKKKDESNSPKCYSDCTNQNEPLEQEMSLVPHHVRYPHDEDVQVVMNDNDQEVLTLDK